MPEILRNKAVAQECAQVIRLLASNTNREQVRDFFAANPDLQLACTNTANYMRFNIQGADVGDRFPVQQLDDRLYRLSIPYKVLGCLHWSHDCYVRTPAPPRPTNHIAEQIEVQANNVADERTLTPHSIIGAGDLRDVHNGVLDLQSVGGSPVVFPAALDSGMLSQASAASREPASPTSPVSPPPPPPTPTHASAQVAVRFREIYFLSTRTAPPQRLEVVNASGQAGPSIS